MTITKEALKKELENFPEEFSIEELFSRLVFIEKVNQGLEDVKNGRTVDHDELKREMEQWFK